MTDRIRSRIAPGFSVRHRTDPGGIENHQADAIEFRGHKEILEGKGEKVKKESASLTFLLLIRRSGVTVARTYKRTRGYAFQFDSDLSEGPIMLII